MSDRNLTWGHPMDWVLAFAFAVVVVCVCLGVL
jgi:hypothetical protein